MVRNLGKILPQPKFNQESFKSPFRRPFWGGVVFCKLLTREDPRSLCQMPN